MISLTNLKVLASLLKRPILDEFADVVFDVDVVEVEKHHNHLVGLALKLYVVAFFELVQRNEVVDLHQFSLVDVEDVVGLHAFDLVLERRLQVGFRDELVVDRLIGEHQLLLDRNEREVVRVNQVLDHVLQHCEHVAVAQVFLQQNLMGVQVANEDFF